MSEPLPKVFVVRHAQTEWALTGQHTGRTDIPLTEMGRKQAALLRERLAGLHFAEVWTSPSSRARTTCELAGFGERMQVDPDLHEWDYGQYEGLRSADILKLAPGWRVFKDGAPGGESPDDIRARAARVIAHLRAVDDDVLIFSSGHFSRALSVCWMGVDLMVGHHLALDPTGVCTLCYDHTPATPTIALWNDTEHLRE